MSLCAFWGTDLFAEDVELFIRQAPESEEGIVIFLMDTSAGMNTLVTTDGGIDLSRLDVIKAAASRFIQQADNINLGLMSLSDTGGRVDFVAQNIEDNRQGALDIVNAYVADGPSPLLGALMESRLYLRGSNRQFDNGDSIAESLNGESYISPIKSQCQRSNVVLLTDGVGTADQGTAMNVMLDIQLAESSSGVTLPAELDLFCQLDACLDEYAWVMNNADLRDDLPGFQTTNIYTISGFGVDPPPIIDRTARFGGGMNYNVADADQLDDALSDILARVVSENTTFTAPATSTNAFNALETAEDVYYVMFTPGEEPGGWRGNLKRYRLGDDNQIYDADGNLAIDPNTGFFADTARSFWSTSVDGSNIEEGGMAEKRSQTAPVYINMTGNQNVSLSSSDNSFHESNSLITADMFRLVDPNARDILIQWGRGVDVDDEDGDGDTTDDRLSVGDPLHTQPQLVNYFGGTDKTVYFSTNTGFLHAVNTADGTTEFSFIPQDLIENVAVYRGRDSLDTGERITETFFVDEDSDIWHSIQLSGIGDFPEAKDQTQTRLVRPGGYRVVYQGNGTVGSVNNPQIRVVNNRKRLQITDSGGAHSWDDYEMQVNEGMFTIVGVDVQYVLHSQQDPVSKIYGLDGPMTVWVNDLNEDGDILQSDGGIADPGEHVYLYQTMRRGGNNIYALDVTNRTNPILKWVIEGGSGDFTKLGQTWSAPILTKVLWNDTERQVLLFGGGYDPEIDEQNTLQSTNIGNAVFMVDAESGQLLWSASNENSNLNIPELMYSIPADLATMDYNNDGLTDYFFAADTGGQLSRFDINENNIGASNFADGGIIAELSADSGRDVRRFFNQPDVSISPSLGYLNIAIGSGDRTDPLGNDTDDRIYVVRDPNISQAPSEYTYDGTNIITEASLYDATDNQIQDDSDNQRQIASSNLENSHGWYIRLESEGEKVMSKAITYNNFLYMNTFANGSNADQPCVADLGINYFYALDIENARAVISLSNSENTGSLSKLDRRLTLRNRTIAGGPFIINRVNEGLTVCVGTECFENILDLVPITRQHWRENR